LQLSSDNDRLLHVAGLVAQHVAHGERKGVVAAAAADTGDSCDGDGGAVVDDGDVLNAAEL
jgi:hypothetical protein